MATSGSASTSVTNGKRVMKMTWQLVSQDPDTNVSEVKVAAHFTPVSPAPTFTDPSICVLAELPVYPFNATFPA